MKIAVQFRLEWYAYAVYRYCEVEGRGREFGQPDGTRVLIQPGQYQADLKPTFLVPVDEAPDLIEQLQKSGVQPKVIARVEGQLEAQSAHLADLQKILRKQGVME